MRTSFVDANTLLEEAYFAEGRDVLDGRADLDAVKTAQVREGAELVARVADEDRLPTDPDGRYELLGMVGYVLGACRCHEVDLVDTVGSTLAKRVWTTASRLGSSLGVAPRFVFAHQAVFNTARRDSFRTFTSLPDEAAFLRSNGLAVLAYRRAAHSLRQISPMGVSNPMAAYLLENAHSALGDVLRFNQILSKTVDVTRFYLNIRPYFKPYHVGGVEWRGANAGDFAARPTARPTATTTPSSSGRTSNARQRTPPRNDSRPSPRAGRRSPSSSRCSIACGCCASHATARRSRRLERPSIALPS